MVLPDDHLSGNSSIWFYDVMYGCHIILKFYDVITGWAGIDFSSISCNIS